MNFLKKIFSPTILTISLLLLIYTFYKSEIIWDGEQENYYKTYYLISSILICLSIITFFINDKIKEYLIISGISLIVSLYLFEGYLTLKSNLQKSNWTSKEQLYEKQTGNKWDRRSKLEIYKDLKKNNSKITFLSSKYLVDKNYSNVPFLYLVCQIQKQFFVMKMVIILFIKVIDMDLIIQIMNGIKKKSEYLLVGDSFTHGACVNRPNDISSVLRSLSKKSVLNLGMGGNGPLIEYATLREYLNTKVKKVLWIYFEGNDLQIWKMKKQMIF